MKRLCLTDAYPVDKLEPHPLNYRRHTPGLKDALARGQHRTVAVRAHDPKRPLEGATLLAGHGVWAATRELGRTVVAATVVQCSDDEAEEIVAEDNRRQQQGANDPARLADLLDRLLERGSLERVGYTADDYDDLLAAAGRVQEAPPQPFTGGYAETEEETQARARTPNDAPVEPLRQVVLVFRDHSLYSAFMEDVKALRRAYTLEEGGVSPVVAEAVRRAAEAPAAVKA